MLVVLTVMQAALMMLAPGQARPELMEHSLRPPALVPCNVLQSLRIWQWAEFLQGILFRRTEIAVVPRLFVDFLQPLVSGLVGGVVALKATEQVLPVQNLLQRCTGGTSSNILEDLEPVFSMCMGSHCCGSENMLKKKEFDL